MKCKLVCFVVRCPFYSCVGLICLLFTLAAALVAVAVAELAVAVAFAHGRHDFFFLAFPVLATVAGHCGELS